MSNVTRNRNIIFVHVDDPVEKSAAELVKQAPNRQGAVVLRALVMLGYWDVKSKEEQQNQNKRETG